MSEIAKTVGDGQDWRDSERRDLSQRYAYAEQGDAKACHRARGEFDAWDASPALV
jgi:hypothetical protein